MSGRGRLAAFAGVLVVILAGAFMFGRVVDLDAGEAVDHGHAAAPAAEHGSDSHADGSDPDAPSEAASPALIAQDGLRLVVAQTTWQRGVEASFTFRIVDAEGKPVEDYDVVHDERMHLIVARRDLGTYQHVHPTHTDDGGWTVPLRFDETGVYRVFADFTTNGQRATLGADLFVPGDFAPRALPAPTGTATTGDYEVRLSRTPSDDGETVEFTVLQNGQPVNDLQSYLGAQGHLVALREGDLSFLHVHPVEGDAAPGRIAFAIEYPSDGSYRLFLQFKHDGRIQTVAFTRNVEP